MQNFLVDGALSDDALQMCQPDGYSLRPGIFPQSPQDQAGIGIRRLVLSLFWVVIGVIKDIANKVASLGSAGHVGQEVGQVWCCFGMDSGQKNW
jgi:hypothetical protein